MKKLLILEVGNTHPFIAARRGDFVDWFVAGLQVDPGRLEVLDPRREDPGEDPRDGRELPAYAGLAGVLITGSHAMVTDGLPWSERLAGWLRGAVERGLPTLGVCYGHQLLAHALGGEVGATRGGPEYGTVDVTLSEPGQSDPLLGGLGSPLRVQVGHYESVRKLPPGAVVLAAGERDAHQAIRMGGCAWGVQFHPEMEAEVVREYIRHNRESITASGQDPEALLAGCEDTPAGGEILRRFGGVVFPAAEKG
jgi:GMP synthase (glutamine-hydrolysing)